MCKYGILYVWRNTGPAKSNCHNLALNYWCIYTNNIVLDYTLKLATNPLSATTASVNMSIETISTCSKEAHKYFWS